MEQNGNSNAILLTVICVATLLVALVGATFAFFTASSVTGNNGQSVSVQAAQPVGVTQSNGTGNTLVLTNATPGDKDTKTFTITNGDTQNKHKYDLKLVIDSNTFNTTDGANQLEMSFETSSTGANTPAIESGKNPFNVTNGSVVREGINVDIAKNQIIDSNEVHTYTVTLFFKDIGTSQDNNANNAVFVAHFHIDNDRTYIPAAA